MAGLQLSGLASGFDWKSVVEQLIQIERVPQQKMRTEKTANTNKLSVFTNLRTKLTAFQDAAKALSSTSLFGQRTVSMGDADLNWSATASSSAVTGEYAFNVTRLATQSVRRGASDVAGSLNATDDVSGLLVSEMRTAVAVTAGTFTINGSTVEVESTDTLDDVFDKISTATGGAVTAAYSAASDRVTLTGSGTITLGGGGDTSNFLYALKLYNNNGSTITSSTTLGTIGLRDDIAAAGLGTALTGLDAEGNGSFTINGVTIDYNVNDDSLSALMARVNASDAGVTMSYDAPNDRFSLTNKGSGDLGLSASDGSGNLLTALRLTTGATVTRGTNAEFSVNGGGTIIASSNVLDASAHGISGLSVTASELGSQTITVANDTEAIRTGIDKLITTYNDVQNYIDSQTKVTVGADGKVTAGLMAGNREFTDIARQLRSQVFSAVGGASADMSRLESIGIDFEGTGSTLAVRDSAKLTDALTNDLSKVSALFTTSTTGISGRVDAYISRITLTGGQIDNQENSLEKQNTSLDKQIADLERRITAEQERLEASFIAMEEAQSKIQSQLSALSGMLSS
ncbi:MAG: flagellar filament capping protein FliD [Opitutaceae bacterium]|nr:flagellar filament capping protein FliD [Opitutaceae bacterium]